jgi:hypothetical protein
MPWTWLSRQASLDRGQARYVRVHHFKRIHEYRHDYKVEDIPVSRLARDEESFGTQHKQLEQQLAKQRRQWKTHCWLLTPPCTMYMRHLELLERHLELLLLVCVCARARVASVCVCVCVCVRERDREREREKEFCVVCDRMQNFTRTEVLRKNSCNEMQNFTRSKALRHQNFTRTKALNVYIRIWETEACLRFYYDDRRLHWLWSLRCRSIKNLMLHFFFGLCNKAVKKLVEFFGPASGFRETVL